MNTGRAERAVTDVVAVERLAPGMARVVTFGGVYTVDARGEGCLCPDKKHNLGPGETCKHHIAAVLADRPDLPTPFTVTDNLSERVAADGGRREKRRENPVEECDHEETTVAYLERADGQHEVQVCDNCRLILENRGNPEPDNVATDGGEECTECDDEMPCFEHYEADE